MDETILIIEDEDDILDLISNILGGEGYTILTASNGKEGVKKFEEFSPDLIITDVRMPVMDGIEVLKEVKAKESKTDVIILTGHSDEATAIDCLRLGAYDYFRKPLEDIDVLLTAVRRVLEKRSLEIKNISLLKQLEEMSIKDPLTGLYNYRYLQMCLDEKIARCNRYGYSFYILMVDADHFKDINDTYGHLFGDQVLIELSELIQKGLRASDRAFRYGGEEFLVVMDEVTKSEVSKIACRLMSSVRSHKFSFDGKEASITVSMGGAHFPEDADNKISLIRSADEALYGAKNAGRDRFACFQQE